VTAAPSTGSSVPRSTVGLDVFGRKVQLDRNLKESDDCVVVDGPPPTPSEARVLEVLYAEVCDSWRALVDVRFKLLGLVPALSAVALATLLPRRPAGEELGAAPGLAIATLGFLVTFALMLYDQRNSQLHDELISRGRRIEYELGVAVGQFRGRPGSWRMVKHDTATLIVYLATLGAWIVAAIVLGTR
jgi:hypothetical protein